MKNILITGATSGIGESAARYLHENGYFVVLVARNKQKLQSLSDEFGGDVCCISYDLHDLENIENIFKECKSQGIMLDGFVHCAGIAGNYPVRSLGLSFVKDMMDINTLSFVALSKFAVNRKYSSDNCSIVAMSSLSSLTCYPGTASYSMSKSSLNAFCKVLSKEVLKRGIRVNVIMPGYVRTPMMGETPDSDIIAQQSFGYIEPQEIAYVIEFLLSDKSLKITGSEIKVSAGMNF